MCLFRYVCGFRLPCRWDGLGQAKLHLSWNYPGFSQDWASPAYHLPFLFICLRISISSVFADELHQSLSRYPPLLTWFQTVEVGGLWIWQSADQKADFISFSSPSLHAILFLALITEDLANTCCSVLFLYAVSSSRIISPNFSSFKVV